MRITRVTRLRGRRSFAATATVVAFVGPTFFAADVTVIDTDDWASEAEAV